MPPEFRKDEHDLPRLRVAELAGLVFGSFRDDAPDLETYLGPQVVGAIRRVLNRPARILGRSTQISTDVRAGRVAQRKAQSLADDLPGHQTVCGLRPATVRRLLTSA
jgi:phenylpropionate dioxygenase-like ring-hydroxylating dioxygenase large terminal subunit